MTRCTAIFRNTFAILQSSSFHRGIENICRFRYIKNRSRPELYKAKILERALYLNRKTLSKRPECGYLPIKFSNKKR